MKALFMIITIMTAFLVIYLAYIYGKDVGKFILKVFYRLFYANGDNSIEGEKTDGKKP